MRKMYYIGLMLIVKEDKFLQKQKTSQSIEFKIKLVMLIMLMIFTDQNECTKLHQYYLQFWECRSFLIAQQKKKSGQDENEEYFYS